MRPLIKIGKYLPNLKSINQKSKIKCPDCDILMIPYKCNTAIVDKCHSCQGIWFDKSELGQFRDSLNNFHLEKLEVVVPTNDDNTHTISSCPRCNIVLSEAKYSYNSKVTIKRCDKCDGIWLPLAQVLKFIDLVRLSQILAPEIKGAAKELAKFNKKTANLEKMNKVMSDLNAPIPLWRLLILRFFSIILPLYDENPRLNTPWITSSIVVINVFTFILMLINYDKIEFVLSSLALVPSNIYSTTDFLPFVTSMFLHGGILHLVGNMFFLWIFGDNVEDHMGPIKYLFFYLFCGFSASAIYAVFHADSVMPVVGASGAISGILGAYLYLFPSVNLKTMILGAIVDVPVWIYIIGWFALQLINFLMSFGYQFSKVAYAAHLGGFFTGIIVVYLMDKLSLVKQRKKAFS